MKKASLAVVSLCLSVAVPAYANDWEKYYNPLGEINDLIPADTEPQRVTSTGILEKDLERMWRDGYAPIGYTAFETSNDKIKDAMRLGKKLKAKYIIINTELVSSRESNLPLTLPNTTTSYSSGTVSAYGSGGYASGTYTGRTTTYGSTTTYIPITISRFSKTAVYFRELPRKGAGIKFDDLNERQIKILGTRKAFVVKWVRDDSPAYHADLLPGDIIISVNGLPADTKNWWSQLRETDNLSVKILREGVEKIIEMKIPEEWRPK